MNLDYTKVTHEQLLDQFRNRIVSDPKFKDLSAASIYQLYMEMMSGTFDMLHFYLGRTAEEMFLDSARLDSSVIKLCKNLGYNPKRAIPATAEIAVKIQGPLPTNAAAGDMIWFNNETLKLAFNKHEFKLDRCYSYTLTEDDIANGQSSDWSKTIRYAISSDSMQEYTPLSTNSNNFDRIKVIQCKIVTKEIYAVAYAENLGKSYQFYDIDDINFSNYYGMRDPFAYNEGEYNPEAGWCKIGIGLNQTDAFNSTKLCDIEIENIYCNSKVKAANDEIALTSKLNVCRVESNSDKTVRITFGDGAIVNNGFNNEDEILYVQYVTTDGYIANTPDVVDSTLDCSSQIFAHSPGKLYDVTSNISFVLTTNISNGADFESQTSMKNNAAVYFAARGQLINKHDFNAYFSSLSNPITVKNAIAWNTSEIAAKTNATYSKDYEDSEKNVFNMRDFCDNARNAVYYTVIGDLYESLGNNQYKIKDFYNDDAAEVVGTASLYNDNTTFLNEVGTLALTVKSKDKLNEVAVAQATANDTPFYMNTASICNELDEKLQFGVVPISIPPIIQYYDLVGTVEMNRLANAAEFQNELESSIYKWLAENQKFNNKIYKSDIIKLIYDNSMTKSVNVDITPSGIIYSAGTTYTFTGNEGLTTDESQDKCVVYTVNGFKNNSILLPILATSGGKYTVISKALLLKDGIKLGANRDALKTVSVKSVDETNDSRLLVTLNDSNYDFSITDSTKEFYLNIPEESVEFYRYSSGGNMSRMYTFYNNEMKEFMSSATTETPVALPYTVKSAQGYSTAEITHELTYLRKGNSKFYASSLTEKSFNLLVAPEYASNNTEYLNAYRMMKFAIEDNILDDNNNIVNFTLPNEIAVVRVKLNYTFGR